MTIIEDGGSADMAKETGAGEVSAGARLVPRITIQAFCEHSPTAELVESAVHDRRMSRAAITTHNGGVQGAIETYRANPTPNLIIIESSLDREALLAALATLADVCDAGTKLIVLGHINDVILYRELMRFGVSEYVVLPAETGVLVDAIGEIFVAEGAEPIGKSVAFVSAKGGAGGSTLCHNVAWAIAQDVRQDVLILDMDLGFGTAGLNFNQDPPHGLADAVFAKEKVDTVMFDRLMSKAATHINLLTAPCTLERTYDFQDRGFEQIVELGQQVVPLVFLDVPHAWNGWVKHTLSTVDEVVIVAEPDLANLRNTKNLADALKLLRPGEEEPMLVINRTGLPKRPEIAAADFESSIDCRLIGQVAFDAATFGTAANNGQMLAEVSSGHKANELFRTLARQITGRTAAAAAQKSGPFAFTQLSKLLKRA
jgi:pilus assembly protein CpaE